MEVGKQPQIRLNDLKILPIKNISSNAENQISDKVQEILIFKENTSNRDTSTLEQEIDQMVYQLYGLTVEEIKMVEGEPSVVEMVGESTVFG